MAQDRKVIPMLPESTPEHAADPSPEALDYIDIVFDGPPSHESGRFVEVENSAGESIRFGEWIHRPDSFWALRIPSPDAFRREGVEKERDRLIGVVATVSDEVLPSPDPQALNPDRFLWASACARVLKRMRDGS